MAFPLERPEDGDWNKVRSNTDATAQRLNPPLPQARVYNSAAITGIVTATVTPLTFDTERFNNGALHSTSANTGRLTAPIDGLYLIGAQIQWESNATGNRLLRLMLNGASQLVRDERAAVNGDVTDQEVTTLYQMQAGDYVTVEVVQSSGANRQINAAPASSPEFWMVRLGGFVNMGV